MSYAEHHTTQKTTPRSASCAVGRVWLGCPRYVRGSASEHVGNHFDKLLYIAEQVYSGTCVKNGKCVVVGSITHVLGYCERTSMLPFNLIRTHKMITEPCFHTRM